MAAPGDADTVRPSLSKWILPIGIIWGINFVFVPLAVIGFIDSRKKFGLPAVALTIHVALFFGSCLVYPL